MPGLVQEKQPSLKRLQNLDTEYPEFEDQLAELASILGLQLGLAGDDVEAREHSRAHWAARWLLKKLQPATDAGAQARANKDSWNLLRGIVAVLPTPVAAQVLGAHAFVAIITTTLLENFGQGFESLVSSAERDAEMFVGNAGSEAEELRSSASPEEPSLKRKRGDPAAAHRSLKSSRTDEDRGQNEQQSLERLWDLYSEILNLVRALKIRSQPAPGSQDTRAVEQMRAILSADTQQAANLLSCLLRALATTFDRRGDLQDSLDTSLWLWQNRKPDPSNSTAVSPQCSHFLHYQAHLHHR